MGLIVLSFQLWLVSQRGFNQRKGYTISFFKMYENYLWKMYKKYANWIFR